MKKNIAQRFKGTSLKSLTAVVIVVLVAAVGLLALAGIHAQSPYIATEAAKGTLGGSAVANNDPTASGGQSVQFQTCTIPTTYPAAPNGGMAYTNWYFDMSTPISSLVHTVVISNNPGTSSELFLQLYDGAIDGTGQYYGLQTNGLAIFSEFGTSDTSDVQPASGATVTSGTETGSEYVSLRYNFGSLPAGTYTTTMERGSYDGTGDWFDYYVTPPGQAQVYIGAIRFPRANPAVPASFSDGGGTWTEDYQNNGTTLFPVPLWHISVEVRANGNAVPDSAKSTYSAMPNSDEYAESNGGFVDQVIGGSTPRCHPAGWLWYQLNTTKS